MSQGDILEVLEKAKKPLCRTEIANIIKLDPIQVSHNLRRLVKGRSVKIIEINREQAMKFYRCKRRMRLYYL